MRDYLEVNSEKFSVIDVIDDILYIVDDWCEAKGINDGLFTEKTLELLFKNQFGVTVLDDFTEKFERSIFAIPGSGNYIYLYQSKSYDLVLRIEKLGSKNIGVFLDCRHLKGNYVDNLKSFLFESRWIKKK